MDESSAIKLTILENIGRQSNPLFTDIITVSPCKQRSDTGRPCPLKDYPKRGTTCPCGLIDPSRPTKTEAQLKAMIASGTLKTTDQEKPVEGKKTCTQCNKELDANDKNFRRARFTDDGLSKKCKPCIAANISNARKNKRITPKKSEFPDLDGSPTAKYVKKDNPFRLDLDLSNYKEIFKQLETQAVDQMRTTKAHAIFILKQAVCQ